MVFPTYYRGEGLPEAVLDSYISGVPVIASDWKYYSEIIKEGKIGKIFISQDIDDFTNKLEFMINNPGLICKMKRNCLEEAKKYDADIFEFANKNNSFSYVGNYKICQRIGIKIF